MKTTTARIFVLYPTLFILSHWRLYTIRQNLLKMQLKIEKKMQLGTYCTNEFSSAVMDLQKNNLICNLSLLFLTTWQTAHKFEKVLN